MIAAVIVWKTGFNRADSIASLFVGFSIIATAIPLMKSSGRLLLEAAPREIDLRDVKDDLTSLEGVVDIHEMHVFSLSRLLNACLKPLLTVVPKPNANISPHSMCESRRTRLWHNLCPLLDLYENACTPGACMAG